MNACFRSREPHPADPDGQNRNRNILAVTFYIQTGTVKRPLAEPLPLCRTRQKKKMMDELFQIPVVYKGSERMYDARLLQKGYTHQFEVQVGEHTVYFEPDEERNYRAMLHPEEPDGSKPADIGLLKAIAEAIETLLR